MFFATDLQIKKDFENLWLLFANTLGLCLEVVCFLHLVQIQAFYQRKYKILF